MNLLHKIDQPDREQEVCLYSKGKRMKKSRHSFVRSQHWAEEFELSDHAHLRARQRGLNAHEICYVLRYGQCIHAADAVIYYLRHIDIPVEHKRHAARLEGTAIITAKGELKRVITVWRNRLHGTRNLHHKLDQCWQKGM